MIDFGHFKLTDKKVSFFDSKNIIERFGIDILTEHKLLPSITKLCDSWKVPYEDIAKYILSRRDLYTCLFDYTTNKFGKKVSENGVYIQKERIFHGNLKIEKIYYDVYICECNYISLMLPKLVEYILEYYYPKFYKTNDVVMYKDIKIEPTMTISELYQNNLDEMLIEDIVKIYNRESVIKKVNIFNIYNDGEVLYYSLEPIIIHGKIYERSLSIPREAIINNDWSIVENCNVSTIKNDANHKLGADLNNFYYGIQKECPYWNNVGVVNIKELFD